MEKRPFFRAATAGLGKYHTGGYGRIGVYRVKYIFDINQINLGIYTKSPYYLGAKQWNDLPSETQNARSKIAIKKLI